MSAQVTCLRYAPSYAVKLADFFVRNTSGCFCRYWQFEGDKNEWLGRLAHAPDLNRRELEAEANESDLRGMVAVNQDDDVVGWLRISRASGLSKIYAQRVYRNLSCFEQRGPDVYAIGCFFVAEGCRRRGVARALLRAGIQAAASEGASAIEAFPRGAEGLAAPELWTGPLKLFAGEGFQVVHDFAPYPVLRLELAGAPTLSHIGAS